MSSRGPGWPEARPFSSGPEGDPLWMGAQWAQWSCHSCCRRKGAWALILVFLQNTTGEGGGTPEVGEPGRSTGPHSSGFLLPHQGKGLLMSGELQTAGRLWVTEVSLSLLGIECPRGARNLPGLVQEGEPFSEEATLFTKELVLQREVGLPAFVRLCVSASRLRLLPTWHLCCLSLLGLHAFVRPGGCLAQWGFPCCDGGQRPKNLPQLLLPLRLPPALARKSFCPWLPSAEGLGAGARRVASPGAFILLGLSVLRRPTQRRFQEPVFWFTKSREGGAHRGAELHRVPSDIVWGGRRGGAGLLCGSSLSP